MKSGSSLWWMSACTSVSLFIEDQLNALGRVIACETERPYAGLAGDVLWLHKGRLHPAEHRRLLRAGLSTPTFVQSNHRVGSKRRRP